MSLLSLVYEFMLYHWNTKDMDIQLSIERLIFYIYTKYQTFFRSVDFVALILIKVVNRLADAWLYLLSNGYMWVKYRLP